MNARILLVIVSCVLSVVTGLVLSRGGSDRQRRRRSAGRSSASRWTRSRRSAGSATATCSWRAPTALGAEVNVLAANSDDTRQVTDVECAHHPRRRCSRHHPAQRRRHGEGGRARACQAGIPVLSYDRLITGCDLDLYMTFDNVKVGELQAQFLVDALPSRPAKSASSASTARRPTTTPRSSSKARTTSSSRSSMRARSRSCTRIGPRTGSRRTPRRSPTPPSPKPATTSTPSSPATTAPPAARSRR